MRRIRPRRDCSRCRCRSPTSPRCRSGCSDPRRIQAPWERAQAHRCRRVLRCACVAAHALPPCSALLRDDYCRPVAPRAAARAVARGRARDPGLPRCRHPAARRRLADPRRRGAVVLRAARGPHRGGQGVQRRGPGAHHLRAGRLLRRSAIAARRARRGEPARARALAGMRVRSGRFPPAHRQLSASQRRDHENDGHASGPPAGDRQRSAGRRGDHHRSPLRPRLSSRARLSGAQSHRLQVDRSDAAGSQPRRCAAATGRPLSGGRPRRRHAAGDAELTRARREAGAADEAGERALRRGDCRRRPGGPRRGGVRRIGRPVHDPDRARSAGRTGGHLVAHRELPRLPDRRIRRGARLARAAAGAALRRGNRRRPTGP